MISIFNRAIISLNNHELLKWMDDRKNIQIVFKAQTGHSLNLDNPKTFNEKIQWLKLYDRNPKYISMVDKYLVRDYIANTIGQQYLIPICGVYDNVKDICLDKLPDTFAMKCTHDSGGVRICRNKKTFDFNEAFAFINKRLKRNCFYYGREWPYKQLTPRIIIEKLLFDESSNDLYDYKIHCFNGEPKIILVCSDRQNGLKEDWFDVNWKHLPITRPKHFNSNKTINMPSCLEEMLSLSKVLSRNIPFVRLDFYQVNNKVYFGEITFYPTSGYTPFVPDEYDSILGSWINLPQLS